MTKAMIAVLGCVVLSGCAYRPIVDPARSDMARFESDLAECRQIAEQAPGPGAGAVVGAAAGYAVGQVAARATGHSGVANEAGRGGAVIGGAKGAGGGARSKRGVIRNCLTGRGHAVLN
ncbi:MAG TPA: glycine zipper family protein [Burkholderiales bacterium]|nr:glycine zipper family protein [Burkholderiales bacterium]